MSKLRYEIPKGAVTEAIVNAVVHRDYTSNASVQVMLFKNRLEVWNPGHLPLGLTVQQLKQPHNSIPANPLLAEPMYLAGYIERMGTGTRDIVKLCSEAGLIEPEFIQEEFFRVVISREKVTTGQDTGQANVSDYDNDYDSDYDSDYDYRILEVLIYDMSLPELQEIFNIKHKQYFRRVFLNPAIEKCLVEMTIPDKPTSKNQKYRLTDKGKALYKKQKKKRKF